VFWYGFILTAPVGWIRALDCVRSWSVCSAVDSRSTRSTVIKPSAHWLLAKLALFTLAVHTHTHTHTHWCTHTLPAALCAATCLYYAMTLNLRVHYYCGNVIMIKSCLQKCKHGHRWLLSPLCVYLWGLTRICWEDKWSALFFFFFTLIVYLNIRLHKSRLHS